MKPLVFLLATAAAAAAATAATLPLVASDTNLPIDRLSAINVAPTAPPTAATALVIFGADTIRAEVANTPALRSQGLMFREAVPDGTGMLFVYEREVEQSFWMQNTFVALDVAWIDANFRIIDIQQMEPESTDIHDGAGPAMFALEVRQGWFAEKDIEVGDRCELIFSP